MKKYRNKGFEDVISSVNELANERDITKKKRKFSTQRTHRKKLFFYEGQDESVDDSKQAFKIKCFHIALDQEMKALEERFTDLRKYQSNRLVCLTLWAL